MFLIVLHFFFSTAKRRPIALDPFFSVFFAGPNRARARRATGHLASGVDRAMIEGNSPTEKRRPPPLYAVRT